MGGADAHRLYAHLAWTTLARVPQVPGTRRASAESHLIAACRRVGAEPVEVCVLPDRVHLLVRYAASESLAALARRLQAASEEAMRGAGMPVGWSPRFAAGSVSPSDVRRLRRKLARLL